jgi:hypothetical protein
LVNGPSTGRLGYTTGGTKNGMESREKPLLTLLARMGLVALILGTALTVAATERVTVPLVFAGTIGWSFVPLLQLLTGLLLVRGFSRDRLRLLAGYFATHRPWSMWILISHAIFLLFPATRPYGLWIIATAAVPILWTIGLLLRFCREELQLSAARSWWRVATHQCATYTIAFAYVFVAVALWPRILAVFE